MFTSDSTESTIFNPWFHMLELIEGKEVVLTVQGMQELITYFEAHSRDLKDYKFQLLRGGKASCSRKASCSKIPDSCSKIPDSCKEIRNVNYF